jgi:hypothetical protein
MVSSSVGLPRTNNLVIIVPVLYGGFASVDAFASLTLKDKLVAILLAALRLLIRIGSLRILTISFHYPPELFETIFIIV